MTTLHGDMQFCTYHEHNFLNVCCTENILYKHYRENEKYFMLIMLFLQILLAFKILKQTGLCAPF
jgi:hypothetical protein